VEAKALRNSNLSQNQNRSKMAVTAELIRQGASILQEACPRCGGVQIKFRGKIYCTNEDNLEAILNPGSAVEKPVPAKVEDQQPIHSNSEATSSLRKIMEDKLNGLSKQLESSTNPDEQVRLLDLITKYVETLEKINRSAT